MFPYLEVEKKKIFYGKNLPTFPTFHIGKTIFCPLLVKEIL